ncbi:hypothetical protein HK405_008280, partial [Cladochytrium tenue]
SVAQQCTSNQRPPAFQLAWLCTLQRAGDGSITLALASYNIGIFKPECLAKRGVWKLRWSWRLYGGLHRTNDVQILLGRSIDREPVDTHLRCGLHLLPGHWTVQHATKLPELFGHGAGFVVLSVRVVRLGSGFDVLHFPFCIHDVLQGRRRIPEPALRGRDDLLPVYEYVRLFVQLPCSRSHDVEILQQRKPLR